MKSYKTLKYNVHKFESDGAANMMSTFSGVQKEKWKIPKESLKEMKRVFCTCDREDKGCRMLIMC